MADDDKLPPAGRFARFRRLAGLSAQLGTRMVAQGARALSGDSSSWMNVDSAERLVATLGDLKGFAMKMGQILSMEADLFPKEVQAVLARLQNQAPAMSYDTVADVITDELGAPPEELFGRFDPNPHAAASLGQVHRAWLKDGRPVAVKVQYPGVGQALNSDLDNLGLLVKAVSASNRLLDGRKYFDEMKRELRLELDYRREAALCQSFAEAARIFADLKVPEVVTELSRDRVLTLEFLEGQTLKDFLGAPRASPDERFRVSRLLVRAVQGPFLVAGRVHADPHPGNFVLLPDGRMGVLDFGAMKQLSPNFVSCAHRLLRFGLGKQTLDVVETCRDLGFTAEKISDSQLRTLLSDMVEMAARPLKTDRYDYATCTVIPDLRSYGRQHALSLLKVRPPLEGILYFRALGGLVQNLRRIEGCGDYRKVYEELLDASGG